MKNKKGISIVVLILVLVVVGVIATVMTVLLTNNSKKQIAEDIIANENGVNNFMNEVAEMGKENSKVELGSYKVPSESDFVWDDVEGGVCITRYLGTIKEVEIPSTIAGKNVVEIGPGIFSKAPVTVTEIKIPDTVKK